MKRVFSLALKGYDNLFLFFGKELEISFEDFFIGKVLKKAYLPYATDILILLAVLLAWYEKYLVQSFSFLGHAYLVPAFFLAALFLSKKEAISIFRAHFFFMIFLFFGAISSLVASFGGADPVLLFSGWYLFFQFGMVLLLSQSVLKKRKFLISLMILSLPLSVKGIYQFLMRENTPLRWLSSSELSISTRAYGFFGSPNVLGAVAAILGVLALSLFLKEGKKYYAAFGVLSFVTLLLTFSRSSLMGFLASIVVLVFFLKGKRYILLPLAVSPLLGIFDPVRTRMMSIFSQNFLFSSYLDGRVWAIINGLHIFKLNVLLGTGPGTYGGLLAAQYASPVYLKGIQEGYTALYFTDNQWLEILVQTGALGMLAFILFYVSLFVFFVKQWKEESDILYLGGISLLVCFGIMGFFANVLEFSAVSITMAVVVGCIMGFKNEKNSSII